MPEHIDRFAEFRPLVNQFVTVRFPEEARAFAVAWDVTLEWLASLQGTAPTDGGTGILPGRAGLGLVGDENAYPRLTAALAALALAWLELEDKKRALAAGVQSQRSTDRSATSAERRLLATARSVVSHGAVDVQKAALLAESQARTFRRYLSSDDTVAIGDLFGRLVCGEVRPRRLVPFQALQRDAVGRVELVDLADGEALSRKRAMKGEFSIFLDHVAGKVYAKGQLCQGTTRRTFAYALLRRLLESPNERHDYTNVARLVDPDDQTLRLRKPAMRAVLGWVDIARRSLRRACGDDQAASWIVADAGEVFLGDKVTCCLLVASDDL
jgi:hypothetical protein